MHIEREPPHPQCRFIPLVPHVSIQYNAHVAYTPLHAYTEVLHGATRTQQHAHTHLDTRTPCTMQHYALKEAGLCDMAEVVGAFDINTVANEVYSHNFPKVDVHARLIESVG
jgi:hypothetical protein